MGLTSPNARAVLLPQKHLCLQPSKVLSSTLAIPSGIWLLFTNAQSYDIGNFFDGWKPRKMPT